MCENGDVQDIIEATPTGGRVTPTRAQSRSRKEGRRQVCQDLGPESVVHANAWKGLGLAGTCHKGQEMKPKEPDHAGLGWGAGFLVLVSSLLYHILLAVKADKLQSSSE